MKRYLNFTILLYFVFNSLFITAQIKTGKIQFEKKVNLQKRDYYGIQFYGEYEIPKYSKNFYSLNFNDSVFVFTKNSNFESSDFGIGTELECSVNLNKKTRNTIFTSFSETSYLVDTLMQYTWKITGQKRNIAGYNCRKAIWQKNDSTRIYAWFTEAIETPVGPDGFSSLPGAILGLASEDGSIVYFATSVEAKEIENKDLYIDFKNKKAISIKHFKKQNEESEERKYIMKNIIKDLLWY
jgi:GLPGLI family protein